VAVFLPESEVDHGEGEGGGAWDPGRVAGGGRLQAWATAATKRWSKSESLYLGRRLPLSRRSLL
jgi:hypothetical protein